MRTLKWYLDTRPGQDELQEVELFFSPEAARFVGEQRYMFGFVEEERQADGVKMRFRTPVPEYMARWLLQYTDGVKIIRGDTIEAALSRFSALRAYCGIIPTLRAMTFTSNHSFLKRPAFSGRHHE